jgi:RND family efflux transporter MFP subunit
MKVFLKFLLALAIIGGGIAIFKLLESAKADPEKKPPPDNAVVVTVEEARAIGERVIIAAMGTVIPSRSVTLFPEVGGKVVYQSPKLIPGGHFKSGERILRIDPRDYNLMLQQQEAGVRRAEMELATEKARGEVARKEWDLIKDEVQPTEEGRKLALREIQLETAQASLSSAKSGLEKARLSRNRTVIKAPFNGTILEEFVDKGQVLAPGARIATLVDSDTYWVRVSVPVDRLPWIKIPGINGAKEGSPASVIHKVAQGRTVVREGRVKRLLGDLDMKGKMARLLVELIDPMATNPDSTDFDLPLLIGAYVNVEIEGPMLTDVILVSRLSMRDKDKVWINRDGKLEIAQVEVAWVAGEKVYIRDGLEAGDQVVTSHIAAPVDGMKIKLETNGRAGDAGPDKTAEPPVAKVSK